MLFLDEIHRFNRAQQDALLPAVEDGLLTLIGATTQNPWYEVNAALVSRMRVLGARAARAGGRGRCSSTGPSRTRTGSPAGSRWAPRRAPRSSCGPAATPAARSTCWRPPRPGPPTGGEIPLEAVQAAAGGRAVVYDRQGDAHYDTISAFIKSLRGSDPDAAIYYLAVMLKGGEDPKFIARRLIVAASEDVGNADPRALEVAVAAGRAVEFVGLPEARIALAQATTYIALAPKSNASYRAIDAALARVEQEGARRPPLALRDSSVANARGLGNGEGYRYPHDFPDAVLDESLLPEGMEGTVFYAPTDRGAEAELAERLRRLRGDLRADDQPF